MAISKAELNRLALALDRQRAETLDEGMSPERWAFRAAAAVLSSFDPSALRPLGQSFKEERAVRYVLPDSERVFAEGGEPAWALRDEVRRRTLARLGSRGTMLDALKANSVRPQDPVQQAFEALLRNEAPSVEEATPEELAGQLAAVEWLDGILPDLPPLSELQRRAGMLRLLAPQRRLVGTHFQGRESVLTELRDYVGVLPGRGFVSFARRLRNSLFDSPPLMIWGPGGVGKSTVIAKFVLDHAAVERENRFPFVYLNFDRTGLLPEEPLTLMREAIRQVGIQYPEVASQGERARGWISDTLASHGGRDSEASLQEWASFIVSFRELVEAAEPRERPLLFVLDTFEEVQYLGADRVDIVWRFVNELLQEIPSTSVVFAGRSELAGYETTSIELGEFDHVAATALVQGLLVEAGEPPLEPSQVESLLEVVGTVPLSLHLAVGLLIQDQDRDVDRSLGGVGGRRFFLLRAKAAQVQGQLYGRLLDHIHNPEVRKLAYPGLILRRITPEIISEVLAEPCEVQVESPERARELFDELAREAALVELDPDGALEHRRDVRRLMLGDLASQAPEKVASIHHLAVEYYSRQGADDLRSRAEEIYHRACLEQDSKEIESRWVSGIENWLGPALEELAPVPRLALSVLMGVTPDEELLAQADLESWEQVTSNSARRYLGSGNYDGALELLSAREERSPGSPLYSIEAESLRAMGRRREAIDVALRGVESAESVGKLDQSAELLLIVALAHEAEGDLDSAVEVSIRAAEAAAAAKALPLEVRARAAVLRLDRKRAPEVDEGQSGSEASEPSGGARGDTPLPRRPPSRVSRGKPRSKRPNKPRGRSTKPRLSMAPPREKPKPKPPSEEAKGGGDPPSTSPPVESPERAELLARLKDISRDELRRNPAMLREVVAELGDARPDLVQLALQQGGIGAENQGVSELLERWDRDAAGDDLAKAAGLDVSADRAAEWKQWSAKQGGGLGRAVASLIDKVDASDDTLRGLTKQLRDSVDRSLRRE